MTAIAINQRPAVSGSIRGEPEGDIEKFILSQARQLQGFQEHCCHDSKVGKWLLFEGFGVMAHIGAFNQEHHVLSDIGSVIRNAFKIAGYKHQMNATADG